MRPRSTAIALLAILIGGAVEARAQRAPAFNVHEATIADIQRAIQSKRITTLGVVEQYLRRIKAYNGTCVNEPQGILGPVTTIAHAKQINALSTLNLRPAARAAWKFDARKARSLTDKADSAANMPDALETAAAQDQQFAKTGRLVGPLHGVVLAYLGRRDEAIREGLRGVELDPVSKDGFGGPYIQLQLVRIYLLAGESEKALDQLEPLLKIPYHLTPGWLRIDPTFDPVRKNPRFEKLAAQ